MEIYIVVMQVLAIVVGGEKRSYSGAELHSKVSLAQTLRWAHLSRRLRDGKSFKYLDG